MQGDKDRKKEDWDSEEERKEWIGKGGRYRGTEIQYKNKGIR